MEGSTGFQDSMQANYQYPFVPLSSPMCQDQLFIGDPSSNVPSTEIVDPLANVFFEDEFFRDLMMKWTDEMARLLITAVSYVAEAETSELDEDNNDDRRNKQLRTIPKIKKWDVISTAMNKRGFNVSPQDCEDKFRDMNNKYKQMIGLLGRAMSCDVVENPMRLESINIPENQRQEARNLLWSEQFLYREMCSLHNKNRLFLPHDWELRGSLIEIAAGISDQQLNVQERNPVQNENDKKGVRARWVELEEKSLEIRKQKLQFEKSKLEWICLKHNEEVKLEKARLENESLKLENARLAFALKRRDNNYP